MYLSQGATFSLPISARVMSNGSPKNNLQVNFSIVGGSGNLSAASTVTGATGYATITLSGTNITVAVQGVACVAPGNSPCAVFNAYPVPLAQQVLQQVSGSGQISTGALQPVVVRVVDMASSPHSVVAAPVIFLTTVMRPGGMVTGRGSGVLSSGNPAMPVILKVTQNNALTDASGLASIAPSSAGFSAPVEVDVTATAGTSGFLNDPLFVLPAPALVGGPSGSSMPAQHPLAVPVEAERFVRSGAVSSNKTSSESTVLTNLPSFARRTAEAAVPTCALLTPDA